MDIHFLPGQHYDCLQCAKSCRTAWKIPVSQEVFQGLIDSESVRRVEGLGLEPFAQSREQLVLTNCEGGCVFLEGNRCHIHATLGPAAKPTSCRQFPFFPVETPDGLFVGVSFYCTAIARNSGRALAEHASFVSDTPPRLGFGPIRLARRTSLDWPGYRELERSLRQRLALHGHQSLVPVFWALVGQVGPQRLEADHLSALLSHDLPAPPPELIGLSWLCVRGLMGRVEAPGQANRGFVEALEAGQPVNFASLDFRGSWNQLTEFPTPELGTLLPRYLDALLFRKYLLGGRSLLERFLILVLLPQVVEVYSILSALARGAEAVAEEDCWRAVDICELRLVTHGREAEVLSLEMLRACLDLHPRTKKTGDESED
ncbi:MAG: YkgJ family cysteine cluster protein [Vulcanimicrobiota bacterium]